MAYPKVKIDLNKLEHNVEKIVGLCSENNINVAGVTKVFCGNPKITEAYIDGGVSYLADSRIENLIKLKEYHILKILLRLPMISEVEKVVEFADISLNSEIEIIKKLSKKAVEKDKVHGIILMVDLGDLREGFYNEEDLYKAVKEILGLKGIDIKGIGTNLTCYGGVIPDNINMNRLLNIKETIENRFKINLDIISGGNSSHLHFLLEGKNIRGINNLRLGESLVLGGETAYGNRIEDTYDDVFQLEAEIIEVKEKPSIPTGEIGKNAFGKVPTFVDKGIRKRIIVAIGQQDVDLDDVMPLDKCIDIIGSSSDHLLLDGTDSNKNYKVGDIIKFKLTYGGILSTMTSEYVEKFIIQ